MDEDKPVPPQDTPKDTLKRDFPPEASPQPAPGVGPDPKTVSSFERAAIEMAGRATPSQPSEGKPAQDSKPLQDPKPPAEMKPDAKISPRDEPAKPPKPKAAFKFVDQFDLSALPFTSAPMAIPPPAAAPALKPSAIWPRFDDTFRITFTTMQSLIVVIAIGLIVLGAFGMATYSSIIAYDWSCRVGLVEKYCPSAPQPKPLPRPEIPT